MASSSHGRTAHLYGPSDAHRETRESVGAEKTKTKGKFRGAPGRDRTPDPLLRRQLLYPTELPGRKARLAARPRARGRVDTLTGRL